MRKNFRDVGFYPQPVLIIGTYSEDGTPNAMNVGWGGMVGSRFVEINISRGHKTTENILAKKAFTMSYATKAHLIEADYVGLVSGSEKPDKIAAAGLHAVKGTAVDAPIFEEFPLALECRAIDIVAGPGGMRIVGEVLNMSADESILGEDGMVDADKAAFLSFDRLRRKYRILGEIVGTAYRDGEKLMR